jgi:tetratricopeptide (TPR) repeat protein
MRAIVPLVLTILIAGWGIKGFWNKKPTFYAFLFYLATFSIVSNIVFPIGSFMNERFMYIPSIGFAMFLGIGASHGLYKHFRPELRWRPVFRAITVIVLLGFSYKTISRNTAWKNDLTLSTTDVEISTNSAKANMSAGLSLINKAQDETDAAVRRPDLIQAVTYLNKSLALYPTYIQPMLLMGNAYFELGDYANSLVYFERCLQISPGYSYAVNNIEHVGDISSRDGDVEMALKSYILLSRYTPNKYRIYMKLGQIYGRDLQDNESALSNFLIADKLKPNDVEVLNKLGIVYSMLGRGAEALDAFSRVLAQDPNNANTLLNIGITYNQMGDLENGKLNIEKAISIDPSLGHK